MNAKSMSADTMSANSTTPLEPPQLRVATFDDFERMAQLEHDNGMTVMPKADWLAMWVDNPLWPRVRDRWPIGWLLEDAAGRLVGTLVSIPTLYVLGGRELICATGRGWAVDPEYRGYALWLINEYFDQAEVDLFVNTTVAHTAEPVHDSFSKRIPGGDFRTVAYWVTSYRGFAKKVLQKLRVPGSGLLGLPAGAALWGRDLFSARRLPPGPAGISVEFIEEFDDRFDGFWDYLQRLNPDLLLSARDWKTLAWHFAALLKAKRLWIVTVCREGKLVAYGIFKRQEREEGVRRMQLVDFQTLLPNEDLLVPILRVAISRCRREGLFALEQLGCGVPQRAAFERYAPYRRKLPNWPFFYKANDSGLDAELGKPEAWAASTFDGDASFD